MNVMPAWVADDAASARDAIATAMAVWNALTIFSLGRVASWDDVDA